MPHSIKNSFKAKCCQERRGTSRLRRVLGSPSSVTKCRVEILRRPSLPARGCRQILLLFSLFLFYLKCAPFTVVGDCCQIRVLMNSLNLSCLPVQQKICFPWLHWRNCLLPFVHFDPFHFYWVSFLKFLFSSIGKWNGALGSHQHTQECIQGVT